MNVELVEVVEGAAPPPPTKLRDDSVLALIDSAIPSDPHIAPDISGINDKTRAQDALDILWDLLDPSSPDVVEGINSHRTLPLRALRSLAATLAEKYDITPQHFFLKGVHCQERASRGAGAFTDLYFGKCDDYGDVALKRLRVDAKGRQEHELRVLRQFYHESLKWRKLNHKNVLPFFGVSNEAFEFTACMVLPWIEKGTIRRHVGLLQQEGKLRGHQFVTAVDGWLYQTILGLEYLHQEGLIHGDLHGGNILIDEHDNARLTDFALNTIAIKVTEYYYSSKFSGGTYQYLAPEFHDPEEFGLQDVSPTTVTDIYAFGCLCVELYLQQTPYDGATYFKVAKDVLAGIRPARPSTKDGELMSGSLWKLTNRCWTQRPSDRPSAQVVAKDLKLIVMRQDAESDSEGVASCVPRLQCPIA